MSIQCRKAHVHVRPRYLTDDDDDDGDENYDRW